MKNINIPQNFTFYNFKLLHLIRITESLGNIFNVEKLWKPCILCGTQVPIWNLFLNPQ